MSIRQNVRSAKRPSAKCPFGKMSFGKMSFGKVSFGKLSGHLTVGLEQSDISVCDCDIIIGFQPRISD
jgi:hypothetical protein